MLTMPTRSRRLASALAVLAVVAGLTAVPGQAEAATPKEREQQREIRRKKAEAAAKVDAARASEAQLERALKDLRSHARAEQARVGEAQRALAAAEAAAQAARNRQAELTVRIEQARSRVRTAAISSYVNGGDTGVLSFAVDDLGQLGRRRAFMNTVATNVNDAVDELAGARRDLDTERVALEAAEASARTKRDEVAAGLAEVQAATTAKQRLVDEAEDRLEAALAEAEALRAVDAQLAARIEARHRRLAAEIGNDGRARGTRQIGSVKVTTIRGITVATSLADRLGQLLAAAEDAGIRLSGGGFRDPAGQIATRRRNCGGSNYDVYEKPASKCSPPTARPGRSMHERGLAIDFTANGRSIQSRSNPAFQWLAANAGRFGLRNLPREPWHWSTNGN